MKKDKASKHNQLRKSLENKCWEVIYTKQEINDAQIQVLSNTIKFVQARKPKTKNLPPACHEVY